MLTRKGKRNSIILLTAFIFVVFFGSFGFALMDHHNMENCPINVLVGEGCAPTVNKILFAIQHIKVSLQFTQAVLASGIAQIILLLFFGFFFVRQRIYLIYKKFPLQHFKIFKSRIRLPITPSYILKWIALLNNRGDYTPVLFRTI